MFWNIAGIGRQDMEFWKFIKEMDFISLSETWLEGKGWLRIRNSLLKTHE